MTKKIFSYIVMICMLFTISTVPVTTQAKTSLTVTCKSPKIKSKKMTIIRGKSCALTAKYGKATVTAKAKYKTSNKKIIKVSKKGKVKAVKKGSAKITVRYKKQKCVIKVTVKNPSNKIPDGFSPKKSTQTVKTTCKTHQWNAGKITKKATCSATGSKLLTCKVCGATKTTSIAKTAHTLKEISIQQTCTQGSYWAMKCSVCGYISSENKGGPPIGHHFVDGVCTRCNVKEANAAPVEIPVSAAYNDAMPHAQSMYSPDKCPQHFWQYDHCYYCGKANPQPGVLKGWDMTKKANHEHTWGGVDGINANGDLIVNGELTHKCTRCGIEEPYIWTERCNLCHTVWATIDMPKSQVHHSRLDHPLPAHGTNLVSLAEDEIYLTDRYYAIGGTNRMDESVINPYYLQSNLTGKGYYNK